jgi:hypothetical protein
MWLFVSGGFLSIVAHRHQPDDLVVRARHADHLQAMFPDAQVVFLGAADYPYRTVLPREVVQQAVSEYVLSMQYDNFKNSISDDEYHDVCLDVWRTMWAYGNRYRNGGV